MNFGVEILMVCIFYGSSKFWLKETDILIRR